MIHEHAHLNEALLYAVLHAVEISLFVLLMMVIVDYLNLMTNGKLTTALRGNKARQYVASSFLGVLPGCLGSFLTVTFYIRGMLGFGAMVGCLVASSGDAAFVMLARIPQTAFLLFGILFVLGVVSGWVADGLAKSLGIEPCATCDEGVRHDDEPECRIWPAEGIPAHLRGMKPLRAVFLSITAAAAFLVIGGIIGPGEWNWIRVAILVLLATSAFILVTVPDHYLQDHIGKHISRHHLPRVFAWTLGTLLVLALGNHFFDLSSVVSEHPVWVLVMAALVGLIPDSGPHLLFVFLYADGAIPFSVLLTSAIVQDGHGLLPLLAASVRDSIRVKAFNLVVGLLIGLLVLALGH